MNMVTTIRHWKVTLKNWNKNRCQKAFKDQSTLATVIVVITMGLGFGQSLAPEMGGPSETKIIPGQYVFLNLPWEVQSRGGICVGGAAINVLKFMDPELDSTDEELFATFGSGRAGATDAELCQGIALLGFEGTIIQTTKVNRDLLVDILKRSLEEGRPICAGKRSHMIIICGYDEEKEAFLVWDQRDTRPKEMGVPPGCDWVNYNRMSTMLDAVTLIRKNERSVHQSEQEFLEKITGNLEDLKIHRAPLQNGELGPRQLKDRVEESTPIHLMGRLRAGRDILVYQDGHMLRVEATDVDSTKTKVQATVIPENQTREVDLDWLGEMITEKTGGNFYSAKSQAAIPRGE